MTEQHGDDSTEDRPGPYRGVFGSADAPQSSGTTPYGDHPSAYGDTPAAYGGAYGAGADADQANPPKQVTIAPAMVSERSSPAPRTTKASRSRRR